MSKNEIAATEMQYPTDGQVLPAIVSSITPFAITAAAVACEVADLCGLLALAPFPAFCSCVRLLVPFDSRAREKLHA